MADLIVEDAIEGICVPEERPTLRTGIKSTQRLVAGVCIVFALYAAAVPAGRACMRLQVMYNEGWNVYNAQAVAEHHLLYPASPGWTMVNYPALSFYMVAGLGWFTHDFLFTARALSLLSTVLCSLFVALIVRRLTRGNWPALLAGLYCFVLFCCGASTYVGVDDPQILAQVFLMGGLLLYVCHRQKFWALVLVALLLVTGANIKHILIEFPLAIFVDLLFVSRRTALQFGLVGGALVALSIALNIHFGGPGFVAALLAPRTYSWQQLMDNLASVYQPIVLATLIAAVMAVWYRKDRERRILCLLFAASWLTALAFGGGAGVTINVLFGGMLAQAMLLGLFFDDLQDDVKCPLCHGGVSHKVLNGKLMAAVPLFLFVWLIIPLADTGNWRPVKALLEDHAAAQRFQQETEVLASYPGPALCESLLRCYYGKKPYVYDPFNATRFVGLGKLDPQVIASEIEQQEFGTVQFDHPVKEQYDDPVGKVRFAAPILRAVERYYVPVLENEDGVIYRPNPAYSSTNGVRKQ